MFFCFHFGQKSQKSIPLSICLFHSSLADWWMTAYWLMESGTYMQAQIFPSSSSYAISTVEQILHVLYSWVWKSWIIQCLYLALAILNRWIRRGTFVMLLDYLYVFHTQTYSDCSFIFRSWSIHQALWLSLYYYIKILVIIVWYDLTRIPLYDTICYKYDYPW